jgi:hypothetical protein
VGVIAKRYRQEAEVPVLPTPTLLPQSKVILHLETLLNSVWEINSLGTQKYSKLEKILLAGAICLCNSIF